MPTVIVIDPVERRCYETSMDGWQDMVKVCPGGICIAGRLDNDDVLFVDDEGLLTPLPGGEGFRWKDRTDGQPLLSFGIVSGPDAQDGSDRTEDCRSSPEYVQERVEWLTRERSNKWFYDNRTSPAVTITSFGANNLQVTSFGSMADFIDFEQPSSAPPHMDEDGNPIGVHTDADGKPVK